MATLRHQPIQGNRRFMGTKTVQFSCHHCNHCCTEVVCLPTPFDVIRIAKHTKLHPKKFLEFLTPEEVDGVDDDDPTWLQCGDEKYMMALKRSEKTGCTFLDKKTRYCTIYDARPLLCRLYPFKVTEYKDGSFKGFVLHDDVGCPRHQDGVMEVAPLRDIYFEDTKHHSDYDDLVEVFNQREYRGKKPQHFLELLFEGV